MNQIRQGDVWIEKITSIPKKLKKRNNSILAYGEATGHHHKIEGNVAVFDGDKDEMFFELTEKTPLTHQEHGTIEIPRGTYRSYIQQEYSPKAIKKVVD